MSSGTSSTLGEALAPPPVPREDATLGAPGGGGRGWALLRALGVPGAIVVLFVLLAIFGPWIAPQDPLSIDSLQRNLPPLSEGHLLGTDYLGRDMLSRLLAGARL